MAVATFILMEMRRSGQAARFQARHSRDDEEHRHLAFSLARMTPALVLMILLGAVAVFFLLPRMSAGYLGGYSFGTDFSTGFSDRVNLGGIGQIQQSNAVVMHVQIDGDKSGQYDLHWRGVALAKFDGKTWSNPRAQFVLERQAKGYTLPLFSQGLAPFSAASTQSATGVSPRLIHYRVLLEPIGTNVFFLAPWGRRIAGAYRSLSIDAGGAVYDLDSERTVSVYEADSDIAKPTPIQLRTAGDSTLRSTSAYLQVPSTLDPRIPQLAEQITKLASNNYDKAATLETYLKTHYGYTLQLPSAPTADPLANFLFLRRQGHCEYFASSMAVMLRTLHIPSRVVNGFRSNEFNDVTSNYVVRAKDAHSWVEAYFPGYGWITFDPTPGGAIGTPEGWDRAMLYLDAAQSFWREWVVSYDSSHQYILGHAALNGTRSSWERSRMWARMHYARLLGWARRSQRGVAGSPGRWLGIGIAVALLLLILGNAARITQMLRTLRLKSHPERAPHEAAAMWYERMARFLARRGVQKSSTQTAQEFVRVIADMRLRTPVERFTDAYESARFGNSVDDAMRLPELYEEVELATKK
jgi:transglutaminase-like putative cysteine protease